MAQEEQQRCSNSSSGGGGGKVVKKPKPKKIPQRGLGVAQLEKIRLEEIQKKEASSSSSPCVLLPLTHHNHHQSSSSSSIPFSQPCPCPSISSSSPSSNNTLLKSSSSNALPLPNFDLFIPPPTLSTSTSFYGFNNYNNNNNNNSQETGTGASTTTIGHGYFSTMSNPCESNRDQDVTELDPGFALRSRLQNDSNLPWLPPPITMQRKPQPPSPMVNVCMSSSTSSGLNLQMEPPSNQSYYSNYTPPPHMWPEEEEKMVGMKRPWPFSLDNPPGSSLPYKLPQFVTPPLSRLDESSSCGHSGLFNFEPGNAVFREGPSCSTPIHIEWRGSSSELNSKNGSTEIGALDGKFLTLGLPPTPSSTITSKAKQPLVFPTSRQRELSEFDMIPFPFQVYTDDPYFGSSGSVQQPPFYSFFPPRGQQISRLTAKPNDQRTEIRDAVDLNLRL